MEVHEVVTDEEAGKITVNAFARNGEKVFLTALSVDDVQGDFSRAALWIGRAVLMGSPIEKLLK
ncbi:hypothetical protein [Phenylobacterium sp.]|uniref:hypothetical protein n=1 Tax=Phenylobacterium sp. TaxID=1871053 RepID=UPI002EDA68BE